MPAKDTDTRPDVPQGLLALTGPSVQAEEGHLPVRGDLAHIKLAGRYFVPHYVVPLQRMAGDMGATIHADPSDDSDIIDGLAPGQRFDLLDSTSEWAWGCLSLEGPVGYVRIEELVDPNA